MIIYINDRPGEAAAGDLLDVVGVVVDREQEHFAHRELAEQRVRQAVAVERPFAPMRDLPGERQDRTPPARENLLLPGGEVAGQGHGRRREAPRRGTGLPEPRAIGLAQLREPLRRHVRAPEPQTEQELRQPERPHERIGRLGEMPHMLGRRPLLPLRRSELGRRNSQEITLRLGV